MAKITTPSASAVVNRHNLPLNDALIEAFGEAWDNFVSEHGREPEAPAHQADARCVRSASHAASAAAGCAVAARAQLLEKDLSEGLENPTVAELLEVLLTRYQLSWVAPLA